MNLNTHAAWVMHLSLCIAVLSGCVSKSTKTNSPCSDASIAAFKSAAAPIADAVVQFASEHERYPESLAELVPAYAADIPEELLWEHTRFYTYSPLGSDHVYFVIKRECEGTSFALGETLSVWAEGSSAGWSWYSDQ